MNPVRVLIVEDEFIIARNLRMVLEELQYGISGHAFNADEAIEILSHGKTDLVLLDIRLGGEEDGIDLGHRIRAEFGLPFIYLTSHSDPATIDRAKRTYPKGFLVKPFNRDELFAAIEIASQTIEPMSAFDSGAEKDAIFVKVGGALKKVLLSEITMLKADRVYVELHRKGKQPLIVRESLNAWAEKLPSQFLRVQRSYIIHLQHIDSVDTGSIAVDGKEISVTKAVRDEIVERLGALGLKP